MKTTFIKRLPSATQKEIEKDLKEAGLRGEDLENGMNSRLADLEDTINITKYLKQEED
ncbi:hypothetical protein [Pontibacillus yanchengensis]|uniref:hypothetical protein n=1 Tax=Pontibacillus yanchengensis TaxID=462910 RepID=UPI000A576B93|nr:hypothetical protein [Pontibacillus yanchengensis]